MTLFLTLGIGLSATRAQQSTTKYLLWYDQPAKLWNAVLPVGNRRPAATGLGDVRDERLPLNLERLFEPVNPEQHSAPMVYEYDLQTEKGQASTFNFRPL